MRKWIGAAAGLLSVTMILSGAASAASSAKPTGELKKGTITFAYADSTGKRLLGFEGNKPNRFVTAISAPGSQNGVTYVKHQKESEDSNGRQNEFNFDKDGGELYNLNKGALEHDSSVLLAEKNAFAGHTFLSYKKAAKGSFSKTTITQLEKDKKRKVVSQGLIGTASADVKVGLVRYSASAGQSPLASIVLTTKSGYVTQDLVGNKDSQSTWRVDDGGEIVPEQFKVIFVTKSPAGYSIAYDWLGFEGHSMTVLQQKGKAFREVLAGSRYTSPE